MIILAGVKIINSTDVASTFTLNTAAATSHNLLRTAASCLVLFVVRHFLPLWWYSLLTTWLISGFHCSGWHCHIDICKCCTRGNHVIHRQMVERSSWPQQTSIPVCVFVGLSVVGNSLCQWGWYVTATWSCSVLNEFLQRLSWLQLPGWTA